MPIFGLGIHVVIALFFAIHVVRTGREMYWLFILFMFPLLGSIVYFLAVYLPSTRIDHAVRKTVSAAARSLDPGRELREARQAFDLTPTAQNQMRLAAALLDAGDAAQAAEHFEACLKGPFASDAEIRVGAASARLENGQASAAVELLIAARRDTPEFRAEQVSLLLGRCYARAGRNADAKAEFATAVQRFSSIESRVALAVWALDTGDIETANAQKAEIDKTVKHWSKHTRVLNKPLLSQLESTFAAKRG